MADVYQLYSRWVSGEQAGLGVSSHRGLVRRSTRNYESVTLGHNIWLTNKKIKSTFSNLPANGSKPLQVLIIFQHSHDLLGLWKRLLNTNILHKIFKDHDLFFGSNIL